jgi:hypothetical protein
MALRTRLWLRRLGWLIALWAGSVLALAALAALIRLLMTSAGLRT